MAEEFQRTKLYQYSANSNLVLEAERDSRRRTDEGTGEVESLHGKLNTVRMGDRINHEKRPELDDRIEKAKQKRIRSEADDEAVKKKKKDNRVFVASKGSTVLTETEDLDSINYRPKTRESRAAYEEILSFVQVSLGDQPQDILRGAADEILSLLKDESMRAPDRQKEIEKIISRQSSEKYNKLVNLGKKITDFHSTIEEEVEDEVKMDEEMGVAVVFEDDDEDAAREDLDEVNESEEEDDDEGGVEAFGSGTLKGEDEGADDGAGDDKYSLSVHDIDAYWLQRQLSRFYTDANISAKLADETLLTLQIADERACENRLVVLLDFDKFDFIKLLLSWDPSKDSFDVATVTSLEQKSSFSTVYIIGEELLLIRSTLVSSKKLEDFFKNPTYAEKQKLEVILNIFPGLTVTMKSFLKILAERSHLSLIPSISDEYTRILLKFKNSTKVRLVIASILQEGYGMLLLNTLKKLTASTEVILNVSYNPKLLGGLILEYNSTLIDASVLNEFSLFFTEG